MTDEELKQLVESNARRAQTMLDNMVSARPNRQEILQSKIQMHTLMEKLANLEEKIAGLLASSDSKQN